MGTQTSRILLIEDDPEIADQLVRGLHREGFRVRLATHCRDALREAKAGGYDALLLDVMIPGGSGFEILKAIRPTISAPILVLTARTSLDDRLKVFQLGADDYIPKPFYMEELIVRLRARLHRPAPSRPKGVCFADVEVDIEGQRVLRNGEDVGLTRHEFALLSWLMKRPGRPVSRRQLLSGPLQGAGKIQERTVDSHIAHIRRKLGPEAGAMLQTVFRIGYRFEPVG